MYSYWTPYCTFSERDAPLLSPGQYGSSEPEHRPFGSVKFTKKALHITLKVWYRGRRYDFFCVHFRIYYSKAVT